MNFISLRPLSLITKLAIALTFGVVVACGSTHSSFRKSVQGQTPAVIAESPSEDEVEPETAPDAKKARVVQEPAKAESESFEPEYGSAIEFFADHSRLGRMTEVTPLPDWADGRRERVVTDKGQFLVYFFDSGAVSSVYEMSAARQEVWRSEMGSTRIVENVERPAEEGLPPYEVLFKNKALRGGYFGDILVGSMSQADSASSLEAVLRAIAKREGLTQDVSMYSTKSAYDANISASYATKHPRALADGYLGMIDSKGYFVPADAR